jgi:hypothetical protein
MVIFLYAGDVKQQRDEIYILCFIFFFPKLIK